MKSKNVTKKLVICAFMAALSYVLMMLQLPFKYLGFLEFEFSDIPAIVCGFAYGPVIGAVIEIIKNLLKVITATTTGGVGELANMVISLCYVVPAAFLWQFFQRREKAGMAKLILCCVVGILGFVAAGIIVNYFVTVPLYCRLFGGEEEVIKICHSSIPLIDSVGTVVVIGITPFNIVKGIVISVLGAGIYRSSRRLLSRI